MNGLASILLLTLLAGFTIPLGGLLASVERIRPQWLENEFRHFVIAFGGGALLAAVALVLVPEGSKALPLWQVVVWMTLGSLGFMGLDIRLSRNRSPASQLAAMLADFVPEALALGAAAGGGGNAGLVAPLLPPGCGMNSTLRVFGHYAVEIGVLDSEIPEALTKTFTRDLEIL